MLRHTRSLLVAALLVSGSVWQAAPALADDQNPPEIPIIVGGNVIKPLSETWLRSDARTTSAEWDFTISPTPTAPLVPDGNTVPLHIGDYTAVGITGPTATAGEGFIIDPLNGGWLNNTSVDSTITFIIPNWIDREPIKYLQIQTLYFHPASEQVGSVIPSLQVDAYKNNLPTSADTQGSFSYEILPETLYKHYSYAYLHLIPNPDYERITVTVRPGYTIKQIVIDTISIPEPASLGMLAIGGLALLRRRR